MRTAPTIILIYGILTQPAVCEPVMAGTATHGGAIKSGQIIHVTSLADSGPGTLRAAVQTRGPRVVLFDIGGTINLSSDLKISIPDITIAGQTAPATVTLTNGTLLVRASNVVVQHIAVRPGPGASTKINDNRDALTIGGGTHLIHDIRIENVSLSWSVDEVADIAGGTRNVTVRNSIIAEGLRNAGHSKGPHSMGFLINKDNQGVAITGNLLAGNEFRNPAIARGSSVFVAGNYIADPGQNSIHFYAVQAKTPLKATIVGNVIDAGRDTTPRVTAVQIPRDMKRNVPNAQIFLADNYARPGPLTNLGNFPLSTQEPVLPMEPQPHSDNVQATVLNFAGARPAQRNNIDARIIEEVSSHSMRIIDKPSVVRDNAAAPDTINAPSVPVSPFEESTIPGKLRVEAWLCARHLAVGGPNNSDCPRSRSLYDRAIGER